VAGSHVAQTGGHYSISLPSTVQPSASTGCFLCSTNSAVWKAYNIESASENAYRISVAVAGFTDADLSIETAENRLTIRGEKQTNDEVKIGDVLYQGIAARRLCQGQRREPGERAPTSCARFRRR
jgi:hypothetical protein